MKGSDYFDIWRMTKEGREEVRKSLLSCMMYIKREFGEEALEKLRDDLDEIAQELFDMIKGELDV